MKKHNHKKHEGGHHKMMVRDFRRRFWISLILTIPLLFLSPMIREFIGLTETLQFTGDIYVLFGLSTVIFLYGGYPFLSGLYKELKKKSPGMMTLIGVAITTAYIYSSAVVFGVEGKVFFWELATLIVIMLLGHWIEMRSGMGASKALRELVRLMPSTAHKVLPDGSTQEVPVDELNKGDRVLIKPGEKIPADGVVVEGETFINESLLTGESKPVSRGEGSEVIGGSINEEGSITVEVEKTGEGSFLSQVIELVSEAQKSKSRTQNLADTSAFWLTIIALSVGAITLIIWKLLVEKDFVFALERAVTVMVITCPHALGLAIPLVVAVSTSLAANNGLLIRDRNAFERAKDIDAVLFDKTGTLTMGEFGVTDVVVLDEDISDEELLKMTASVEAHSEHSIARGIVGAVEETYRVDNFVAIPGKGVEGMVENREVKVVSPNYLEELEIEVEDERIDSLMEEGKTLAFVLLDGKLSGVIGLADKIRPESKKAIDELKKKGIRCMMVTGDNEAVARWVSEEVGLDEYFAGVLPQDKVEKVREVQERGYVVAMTGDGINDAPALAGADVGIAIGAGTDVAIETADIVLVRSNPMDVVTILGLSRETYKKMVQNLLWATGYNVFAIPLAAGVLYSLGVLLSPAVGAILMSLSTIIVAINARVMKV
jgi:Cu2+-exporting ATPase